MPTTIIGLIRQGVGCWLMVIGLKVMPRCEEKLLIMNAIIPAMKRIMERRKAAAMIEWPE